MLDGDTVWVDEFHGQADQMAARTFQPQQVLATGLEQFEGQERGLWCV
jgi:hypothetical protein